MQETEFIWQNGAFVPWRDAKVHVLSHTLHYGGGAFEGIRVYNTAQGPRVFKLTEHVQRLLYSADVIGMRVSYTEAELCELILALIDKNKLQEGYVRPLFYYGYGTMGVNARNNPVELMIACWPWGQYLAHEVVDVKLSRFTRPYPQSTVSTAKLCGNYVNGQLAGLEIRDTHYHEVLLLDTEGYVAEGAAENLFLVKGDELWTHFTIPDFLVIQRAYAHNFCCRPCKKGLIR